jgi:hypothetical protein
LPEVGLRFNVVLIFAISTFFGSGTYHVICKGELLFLSPRSPDNRAVSSNDGFVPGLLAVNDVIAGQNDHQNLDS